MDVIAAYRDVGTYRGAAAICGTPHKTVKRIIEAHRAAGSGAPTPRTQRPKNYEPVADLVAENSFNALRYVGAKHAIAGMTKAAATAYGEQCIRVNSVHPGYADTPLVRTLPEAIQSEMAAKPPMARFAKDHEAASLVMFLLSDQAGFITGSQHLVDGGYTAI